METMNIYRSPRKCLKIFYLLIVALAIIPSGGAAFQIAADEQLPEVVTEGTTTDFNLTITNIHPAASWIIIDTDLHKSDDIPLFLVNEPESISNETPINISIPDATVTVHLHGQVPKITKIVQPGPVTLTVYDTKRTGYAYYRVTFRDDEGNLISESDTRVFSINVPEIDHFRQKINSISDPFLSAYLQDLFDKGLVGEANALADHELAQDGQIPIIWLIGAVCIVAVAAFVVGVRIGSRNNGGDDE